MAANALVMQSGGSTAVWNRSLYGILGEAASTRGFGTVYGAVHGMEGLLARNVVPLSGLSGSRLQRIARTPGAALGSSRRILREEDVPALMEALSEFSVGYCFIIGGNDSAENGHTLVMGARRAGLPLSVVNVPKTIDNDLLATDHSPGYGSAARFIALATMGIGRDVETMGPEAPLALLEVMGRDAGWLAAASVLGKGEERDAPHVVVVPEEPVVGDRFLGLVEDAYARYGTVVVVAAENARGEHGVLGSGEPWYVDDFGHPYYEGAGRYLSELVGRRLGARVRYEKPGSIQRSLAESVSRTDALEAEMAGRAAVMYAEEGATGVMVTLERDPGDPYSCRTGTAALEEVAGGVKTLPSSMYDPESFMPTAAFSSYAEPLIGGPLPRLERLEMPE